MAQINQEIYWFALQGYKVEGVGFDGDEDGFLVQFPEPKKLDHLILSRSDLELMLNELG